MADTWMDEHVDLSTPETPGSCVVTSIPLGVRLDYADNHITISDEIIGGAHDWAWHHRCEVAEGFVRIRCNNATVTYRLTGEQDIWGNWYAIKVIQLTVGGTDTNA